MLRDTSGQDTVIQPRNSLMKNKLPLIGVVAVVVLALIFMGDKFGEMFNSDLSISKERLRFANVVRGDLERDIAVQGKIVAANSPTLYSSSPGIVSLFVKAGDTVTKGQKLAEVESPQIANRYNQELATLEQLNLEVVRHKIQTKSTILNNQQAIEIAKVNLESAEIDKNRVEVSIKQKLISQREYEEKLAKYKRDKLAHKHALENAALQKENMEFELRGKESQLDRQQFVVNDLKRQIEELTLVAPTDGIIGSVNIREKDNVQANAPLITVIDLSAFEVEVNIPENYADDLGVGLASEINFNGEKHGGAIVAISPEVTNGQVVGRIRFDDSSKIKLRQNQRVNARILIESKQNVLKVKRGAFVETGGGRIVYVVENNNAFRKTITLGARSIGEIEVVNGLNEGDKVIISSIDSFNNQNQIYLAN